jgi:SOS-response transcriptional repressor LexA
MSVLTKQHSRYMIITLELPGAGPLNAGVLLEDPSTDRLWVRLRRDWDEFVPEEAEVLSAMEYDLAAKAQELGAKELLRYLQDTLSNVFVVENRGDVVVADFERALARLYRENVQATVRPFVTHLPRYSLAVAAGKFLENQEVEEEGWEEAPSDLRLTGELFVARVQGRSMEPKIPDGSLCVFRQGVTGSRQGRLVLVEQLGGGANDRYTVKCHASDKAQREDGTWSHERITLLPLNPEFDAWTLDPEEEKFRIVAEFVRVLD